jgi:hypothetical protein
MESSTSHSHPVPFNPYALGGGLAVLTIVIGLLTPENIVMTLHAILLFGIAVVYFGFAVADGRAKALLTETLVVSLYFGLATAGLLLSHWWLVVGYVLHGFWDLLHHNPNFGARVANWYIPFCVIYDWIIAVFLAALLLT